MLPSSLTLTSLTGPSSSKSKIYIFRLQVVAVIFTYLLFKEEQHSRCFGLRWMPDDPDTITWPWIKEALASDEITKVKLLSFVTSLN